MSRHTFVGNDGETVTIGWDRPLSTFFVHVLRPHSTMIGEDETIVFEGSFPDELPTAAKATEIAARYTDLPEGIAETLELDRLKTLGTSDGPSQIAARKFLRRS